jgi:SAM-dependent methyltransferase
MKDYFSEIKRILDTTEVLDWNSLAEFRIDEIFYFFQYPDHFKEYYGETRWNIFEKVYLDKKIKGPMNVPIRWKHLLTEHIAGKRVLDLGSSVGAEIYYIMKNLFPKYLLGVEHSLVAVQLARLGLEMHRIHNADILNWDLIKGIDYFPTSFGRFDTTILAGSIFSFTIKEHFDLFQKYMENLCKFVNDITDKYFYFIGLDKYHYGIIRKVFRNKDICTFCTKRSRLVREYKRTNNDYSLIEYNLDRKRDEFYGYVKL